MKNQNNQKRIVVINDNAEIKLKAYDPDVHGDFNIITDVRTAKYLFNHDEMMVKQFGKFTDMKTYAIALWLSDEIVNAVICQGYFEISDDVRKKQNLKLFIERSN